jgi:MYXO-CTERM domain-containing protein
VCGQDQLCRDGRCISACQGVNCPQGQICQTLDDKRQQGVCIQDPCVGTNCKAQETCINGQCVENRCLQKGASQCIAQKMCDPLTGACLDNPCQWTQCPASMTCVRGECLDKAPSSDGKDYGYCSKNEDCKSQGAICRNNYCIPGDSKPPKEEGCSCSVAKEQGTLHWWFGLSLLLLFAGRQRRTRRKERGSHARDRH